MEGIYLERGVACGLGMPDIVNALRPSPNFSFVSLNANEAAVFIRDSKLLHLLGSFIALIRLRFA